MVPKIDLQFLKALKKKKKNFNLKIVLLSIRSAKLFIQHIL